MKIKKLLAVILAGLMCIATLISCVDNKADAPSDTDGNIQTTESTTALSLRFAHSR